ncbi:hypothetical protein [Yersinia aleksiciae]|uniref:hypothetical protein n=1 Tax=Yersinia aleksiciae TaxID=263819 RepID=UPI001643D26E|nr:hypothetical protein [Yersinia aleksiciae]
MVLKSIDTSLRIDGDIDDCVASAFQFGEMGTEGIKLNAILLDGAFKQMEADGLIGNNFLAKFAVVIDIPRSTAAGKAVLRPGKTIKKGRHKPPFCTPLT